MAVYTLLERPLGWNLAYHVLVAAALLLTMALSVVESSTGAGGLTLTMYVVEWALLTWFTSEFLLRVWSAGCRSHYRGAAGRLLFFSRSLVCWVDLATTLTAALLLLAGTPGAPSLPLALSTGLRLLQMARMFRIDRRGETWRMFATVVTAHWKELLTAVYIGSICLILTAFFIYMIEQRDEETKFESMADSMWWAFITFYR